MALAANWVARTCPESGGWSKWGKGRGVMTLGDRAIISFSFIPPLGASSNAYETWLNIYSELEFGG